MTLAQAEQAFDAYIDRQGSDYNRRIPPLGFVPVAITYTYPGTLTFRGANGEERTMNTGNISQARFDAQRLSQSFGIPAQELQQGAAYKLTGPGTTAQTTVAQVAGTPSPTVQAAGTPSAPPVPQPTPPSTPGAGLSVFGPPTPPVAPQAAQVSPGASLSVFGNITPSSSSGDIDWNNPQAPAGWGVGPGGQLHPPSENPNAAAAPAPPVSSAPSAPPAPTPQPAPAGNKQIVYQDGINLYLQNPDGSFRRISNVAELQQLAQAGTIDPNAARQPLPAGANIGGTAPAAPPQTTAPPAVTPSPQTTAPPVVTPSPQTTAPPTTTPSAEGQAPDIITIYDQNGNPIIVSQKAAKDIYLQPGTGYSLSPPQQTPTGPQPGDAFDLSKIPSSITGADWWAKLSPFGQAMIGMLYNSSTAQDQATKDQIIAAFQQAQGLVDPYTREQIRIVQDEAMRAIAGEQNKAAFDIGNLQTHINQLNEDLVFNRDQLTLEQQAEMTKQLQKYRQNLEVLQDQAIEAGLAFSTPRARAERELAEQEKGIAEATQRRFERELRDIELGTARGVEQAQGQIGQIGITSAASIIDKLRQAEQQAGTVGAAGVPYSGAVIPTLGGITGTIPGAAQGQVVDIAGNIIKSQTPQNINALLSNSFL